MKNREDDKTPRPAGCPRETLKQSFSPEELELSPQPPTLRQDMWLSPHDRGVGPPGMLRETAWDEGSWNPRKGRRSSRFSRNGPRALSHTQSSRVLSLFSLTHLLRGPPHLITWELATQGITPVLHVTGSGGRSHLKEAYLVTYLLGKNIRIVACCNHLKQGVCSSKGSICF